MNYVKTFESFLFESAIRPGDEKLVIGVLKGLLPGAADTVKPDFSNLDQHMKRWKHNFKNATAEDVQRVVSDFAGNGQDLSDNYAYLPGNIHPDSGYGRWDEKKVKDFVNDMKRKGFSFYGHFSEYGVNDIVLAKKKSSINTLDISKPLTPESFWEDYYANYVP
jgi:hypothetical protein